MLTGWIVRYDGFIFGSNCSWGRKMEVCRCRTWKRNSGSICQNHFILCQTNLQHQNNYFLDKKNWKSASDRHCDVIFGFNMVKFGVKWPSKVKTWYLNLYPRQFSSRWFLLPMALQSRKKSKILLRSSVSYRHCDVIWSSKITKLVVKCTAAVISWVPPSKAHCSSLAFGFQVKVSFSTYNRRNI